MSRSPKLSMWESVSRSADTLHDASSSGSDSGLLAAAVPLPAAVLAELEASYELGRELGRGVSGVVLLARDRTLDRAVALKVLRGDASERQRARFAREGRLAASLRHPGIVAVLGSGVAAGAPYLAYELVPGARSLAEVISGADRPARLALLVDLGRALGAAHGAGIVHRDVKPANVLVAPDGSVRLTDFGLGSDPQGETLTQTGVMVGTPLFMAPELIRGKHAAVCAATDVWALGVLLYACCVDALPFEGPDLLTLGTRICSGEFLPLRELDPGVDPGVEAVVARALQVDPQARYPDAGAFADALQAALAEPSA
ncbi:MAG: serine/threonine protein kinase, partial [Planctomycetes bacterium]|nr:serine/threonine protein kinase [Planctomycetota bacterium]